MAEPRALFIGTAGWSIPGVHRSEFPDHGGHLQRYSAVFAGAEINSSFYKPHRRSTYERWAATTPDHFRFSVKAPKAITHSPTPDIADVDAFFSQVIGLGNKLGPVLIQLPPKSVFEKVSATALLSAFRDRTPGGIAVEPRHASWFAPAPEDLLTSLRISRVAADPPRVKEGDRPGGWPGLSYFRLHGSPEIYRSSYSPDRLTIISRDVTRAVLNDAETWCIFDNTTLYAAARNALDLLREVRALDRR